MFTRNQQHQTRQSRAVANQEQIQKKDKEEQLEVDDLRPEFITQYKMMGLSSANPIPPQENNIDRNGIYVSDYRSHIPAQRQLQDNISDTYANQELNQSINGETPFQLKDERLELAEERRMIADAGAHTISNAPMQFKSYLPLLNKVAKPPIQRAGDLSNIDIHEEHEEEEKKTEEELKKEQEEKAKREAVALKASNFNDVNILASYFDIEVEVVEIVNGKYKLERTIGDGVAVDYALLVDDNGRYHILHQVKSSGTRMTDLFSDAEETTEDEAALAMPEDIVYSTSSSETGMFEAIFYIQQFVKNASQQEFPLTQEATEDLTSKVAMLGGMMEEDQTFRKAFIRQMESRGKASKVANADLEGTDDLFNQPKHLPPSKDDLKAMSLIASFYNNGIKLFGLERINNDYHLQWQRDLGRNVDNNLGLIVHYGNFYVTSNVQDGYLFKKSKDLAYQPFSGTTGNFEALLYVLSQTSKIPQWKYIGGLLETDHKQLQDFLKQIDASQKSGVTAKDYEKETALNQELGFTKTSRDTPHGANIKLLSLLANNYKVSLNLFDLNYDIKQQHYTFGKPMEMGEGGQKSVLSLIIQNGNFYVVKGGSMGEIYKKEQLKYTTEEVASGVFEALFYVVNDMGLFNNATDGSEKSNWKVVGQIIEKDPKFVKQMNQKLELGLSKSVKSSISDKNKDRLAKLAEQLGISILYRTLTSKKGKYLLQKPIYMGNGQQSPFSLMEYNGNVYVLSKQQTGEEYEQKNLFYETDDKGSGIFEALLSVAAILGKFNKSSWSEVSNWKTVGQLLEQKPELIDADNNTDDKIATSKKRIKRAEKLGLTNSRRKKPSREKLADLRALTQYYGASIMLYYLYYDNKEQMYIYKNPMKIGKGKNKSKFSLMVYEGNFYVMDSIKAFVPYDKTRLAYSPDDIGSGIYESSMFIFNQMNLLQNKAAANGDEQSNWRLMGQMLEAEPKLIKQMLSLIYQDKSSGIDRENTLKSGLTKDRSPNPVKEDYENASLFAQYYQQNISHLSLVFDKKSNGFLLHKTNKFGEGNASSFGLLEFLGNFYVVKDFKNGAIFNKEKHLAYEPDETTRGLYECLFYIIDKEANKSAIPKIGTVAQMQLTNIMMIGTLLEKDENIRGELASEIKEKLEIEEDAEKDDEMDDFFANLGY